MSVISCQVNDFRHVGVISSRSVICATVKGRDAQLLASMKMLEPIKWESTSQIWNSMRKKTNMYKVVYINAIEKLIPQG